MPVRSIELENFKSYAGRQVIQFTDFTCIIGPNGAGKSNLMDALSFVLGVQSRQLRSVQLKDLVYRQQSLHCSVVLTYEDRESKEETKYSRSIINGSSVYAVNGETMGRSEYEEALSEIGVLVKARNFLVFQGDVESLARKTPRELVELMETISGSAEFAKEYDAAIAEKEEAEQARLFIAKQKKHMEQERHQLKAQKNEADKFDRLLEEKANLQTDLYLFLLYHLDQDRLEREKSNTELRAELEDLKDAENNAASNLKAAKQQVSAARRVTATAEQQRVDIDTSPLVKVETEIKSLTIKIKKDEAALVKQKAGIVTQKEKLEGLETEIAEYKQSLEDLVKEYEASQGETILTPDQEQEWERVKQAAAAASAEPRRKLLLATRDLTKERANLATDTEANDLVQQATQDVNEHTERKKTLESNLEKTAEELDAAERKLRELQKQLHNSQTRRDELDVEIEKVRSQLNDAKNARFQSKDEERLHNAIALLKCTFTGVHGRLVDLCRPTQRKYSQSVTVAAGKDMDAIVVDTTATAHECIQYLRDQKIGTATFLPLDKIQVPEPASFALDTRYRMASDVIHCQDESFRRAVRYAVGNTVIADDLDSARELCFERNNARIKAVTLQGAVISRAGTMTGGLTAQDAVSRWKSQDLVKLQEQLEGLEEERSKLDTSRRIQKEIEDVKNDIGSLRNRKQFSKADLQYTEHMLKEKKALLQSASANVKKANKQNAAAEKAIARVEKEVEKIRDEVKAAEEEHYGPFREATGLADLFAYEQSHGPRRDEFVEKKRALIEHITQLEQHQEYESGRDLQKPIERTEKRIAERSHSLQKLQKQAEALKRKIEEQKAELEETETALNEAKAAEKQCVEKVKEAQNAYKTAQSECAAIEKQLSSGEATLERLRGKLHETLQKARVEKVDLPMVGAVGALRPRRGRRGRQSQDDNEDDNEIMQSDTENEAVSQESTRSRTITQFSQQDNPVVVHDQEQAAQVDFSGMTEALKRRGSEREEKRVRSEFDEKIAKVSTDIENITPNLKANEAFDAATQRLKNSKTDHDKAQKDATKATQKFLKIKASRTKRFMEAYNHIEEALKTVYSDMTKSSKHPLGGNAYLSLDDTEEPYKGGLKFNAMPPMKRFRDMEQLSGGEKTVAALSLLFAIHSFHPAPFFVMDEVDAALDNINLRKIVNYIGQRSKTDFQCIVISLKDAFYEHSNSLVGIYRDVATSASQSLTLDLTKYDDAARRRSSKRSRSSDDKSVPNKRQSSDAVSPLSIR